MKLTFDVGVQERHEVSFSFDKFFGRLAILVDGHPVHQELRVMSVDLVKRYDFPVGQHERHAVRIEKERKLLFAGFRPQRVRAYVDGRLVAEQSA
ncbi:hypothetical protein AB0B85_17015 [Micromonospora sp. NPDC049044]|uniref:hypothetical protein n=1 Tax=unclassified Micromonospora TaxID=2617518 RepID=UPI003408FCA4